MALFFPAPAVSRPIRTAPLLTRALAGLEPLPEAERPFAGLDSLLRRPPRAGMKPVSAICFEIANLDHIAALAGPGVAMQAADAVASRLRASLAGPHVVDSLHDRRFLVGTPLAFEAAAELARTVIDELARPIVIDKVSVQVAVSAAVGSRRTVEWRLAEAA